MFNIKPGLENIEKLLNILGNPHLHPRIIHFAGTNGKGSTLVSLEKLLFSAGYNVGATISPHLIKLNERFRINCEQVNDIILEPCFEFVFAKLGLDPHRNPDELTDKLIPTYFEITIAIAFVLFKRIGVDFILLETGMGGRLDATNVIKDPLAVVLTNISFDHQQHLGEDIISIAREKAGIIKKGTTVFSSLQDEDVKEFIIEYCKKLSCPLHLFGRDFYFEDKKFIANGKLFCFYDQKNSIEENITLAGDHQLINTATALAVYLFLKSTFKLPDLNTVIPLLKTVNWPGRLQYLGKDKKILLDGAHNSSSVNALFKFLEKQHNDSKILIFISWKKDKKFITELKKNVKKLNISFQPLNTSINELIGADELYSLLCLENLAVLNSIKVEEVFKEIENRYDKFDLFLITGSLYLIGKILTIFEKLDKP